MVFQRINLLFVNAAQLPRLDMINASLIKLLILTSNQILAAFTILIAVLFISTDTAAPT
jgi:hypothetical protein